MNVFFVGEDGVFPILRLTETACGNRLLRVRDTTIRLTKRIGCAMLCNGSDSMPENKRFLNSNAIKLIAIIAMTVDHIAWAVYPGYSTEPAAIVMHIIGRLTCPIMCYCIAEGYHYTRDVKKYTRRLLIFALISHVPYMLQSSAFFEFGALALVPFATGGSVMGHLLNQTSVMWSLAIGLIMLRVNYSKKNQTTVETHSHPFIVYSGVSRRLELHCLTFRVCNRHESRKTARTDTVVLVLRGALRARVLPLHVGDLRAYSVRRLACNPRNRALQRSTGKESDRKQDYEMGVLRVLSAAPSRDCARAYLCVIYRQKSICVAQKGVRFSEKGIKKETRIASPFSIEKQRFILRARNLRRLQISSKSSR